MNTGETRGSEVNPKGTHNQSTVGTTELGTLANPAVLKGPPVSGNKDVVDLFGHSNCITISCPVMWV